LEPTVILLAEDDADMRDLLAQAFRRAGYEVIEAKNGTELLNFAATGYLRSPCTLPDIIVSDVRMPGFTGMEVLAGLRSSDWAMPVVLISAFADPATHDEAQRLGAAMFLDKPFDVEELLATVAGLVPPYIQ
jgi:DNA-binding NtrC family response regulator